MPAKSPIQTDPVRAATAAELIAAIVKRLVPVVPPPGAAVPFTPELRDAVTTGRLDSSQ